MAETGCGGGIPLLGGLYLGLVLAPIPVLFTFLDWSVLQVSFVVYVSALLSAWSFGIFLIRGRLDWVVERCSKSGVWAFSLLSLPMLYGCGLILGALKGLGAPALVALGGGFVAVIPAAFLVQRCSRARRTLETGLVEFRAKNLRSLDIGEERRNRFSRAVWVLLVLMVGGFVVAVIDFAKFVEISWIDNSNLVVFGSMIPFYLILLYGNGTEFSFKVVSDGVWRGTTFFPWSLFKGFRDEGDGEVVLVSGDWRYPDLRISIEEGDVERILNVFGGFLPRLDERRSD